MQRTSHLGAAAVAAIVATGALFGIAAQAGTLDDVRKSGALRIAYREDAPPFSFKPQGGGAPAGFIVDLCRAVANGLGKTIGVADLKVTYVPVSSTDRFEAITGGKADLLCEATSVTLQRRESLGFSIATFLDGASFVIGPNGPKDIARFAGQKVGVLGGTTTEEQLKRALAGAKIEAEIVRPKTHQEGIDGVVKGTIAAYFGDRGILTALLMAGGSATANLQLADTYLSVEPYGLALRRGDEDFRLAVDRELSRIYRSGEIGTIFAATFGQGARPSPLLQSLYLVSALPQ
jgi:polar amino acid transport system substrate-binding protein/glutamate/aspartate transport system substrate-binding protein